MKYLIRAFLFNVFALWLTEQLVPGFSISGDTVTLMFAGLVLSILMLILKPLLKILFIPVNILTFGLLGWGINVIVIYLLTILVPEVNITPWDFPGIRYAGFVIPSFRLDYAVSLIVNSISITVISHVLRGLSEG
jgi:putative membrane protein